MTLTMPPAPSGSPQQMAMAQYAYLFQMAQQLNLALGQLETGGAGTSSSGGGTAGGGGTGKDSRGYQELKSMIVKTAGLVKRQMDQLSARLEGEYVAVSDFGTYVERLSAYLEANPEALTQYYSFCSDLQANMEAVSAAFGQYRTETEGYIRTGIVGYDGAVPVYGVAVGQGLTVTDVDGETVVDQNNFRGHLHRPAAVLLAGRQRGGVCVQQPAVYHQHHGAGGSDPGQVADHHGLWAGLPVDRRVRWRVFTGRCPPPGGG